MKLEIYEEPKRGKEIVRLRLICEDDIIILQVVDEYGERITAGDILYVHPNGKITRACAVNEDLGFQLDDMGCVQLEDE